MSEPITQEYVYDLTMSQDGGARFSAQSSGLYRFDGRDWRNALTSLNADPFAVTAVALSPDYAADHTVFAGASGVILRSVDGGESWEVFTLPAPPPVITRIAAAPDYARSGTVYAATLEDGVFVSRDRGAHWDAWNFGLIGFGVNALLAEECGSVYAGTELGVFRSRNAGRSWREVAVFDVPVTALAVAGERLFVGTDGMGLWRLRDGDREPVAPDVISGTVDRVISRGAALLILCDNDLLLSRDEGKTWEAAAPDLVITAVAAPGAGVLVGQENGVIQVINL